MNENDFLYDDEDSVKFIQKYLKQNDITSLSDDDIYYIVDLITEFYDTKGYFDDDEETEIFIDESELNEFVINNIKKDNIKQYSQKEIEFVIEGELKYCDSINLFE